MAKPLLVLLCVVLGHVGWWVFCYNRVNASGLSRRTVKLIEKCIILVCVLLPIGIAAGEGLELQAWIQSSSTWWPIHAPLFRLWGAWCAACCFVLGPLWLDTRRALIPPSNLISESSRTYNLQHELNGTAIGTRTTKLLSLIPGNEITKLAISEKVIHLDRRLEGFDRLRIGHLSDLHFTGQLTKDTCRFAMLKLAALAPDLIALTGDIVDYDRCLDWIDELFLDFRAPLGCYFLLGNHERRLRDWREVPRRLCNLGWHDLGASPATAELNGRQKSTRLILMGNERPWFDRCAEGILNSHSDHQHADCLRIGLSHSPDQIEWARSQCLDLLLAGHTHGGQIRLPGIGPLVAPSTYGSRFASGTFLLPPTVMHVSRGLAGVHPLRWNCLPEVSLLTIVTGLQKTKDKIR